MDSPNDHDILNAPPPTSDEVVDDLVRTLGLAEHEDRIGRLVNNQAGSPEPDLLRLRGSFCTAMTVMKPEDALRLFEATDLRKLQFCEDFARRASRTRPGLFGPEELSSAAKSLEWYLLENRRHLVMTGYPLMLDELEDNLGLFPQGIYPTRLYHRSVWTDQGAESVWLCCTPDDHIASDGLERETTELAPLVDDIDVAGPQAEQTQYYRSVWTGDTKK